MSTLSPYSIYKGKKHFPIGIDHFDELLLGQQSKQYYYVDKTPFIYEMIENGDKVNLIPRPRRFGKTLNLSMLHQFLSIGANPALFDGLLISQDKDFCEMHQGKYPVLHLDLQSLCKGDYGIVCNMLDQLLEGTAQTLSELATSPALGTTDLRDYNAILNLTKMPRETEKQQKAYLAFLMYAPTILTRLMYKHYRKKVVVLIDEYDVPLNYAYTNGFYREAVELVRGIFQGLLKGNNYLDFAVLTGCLRVSKESIFTGVNNFTVWTNETNFIGEYFGFTEDEVRAMLDYYGMPDKLDTIRDWYDGFCFGRQHIYCPWDVLKYVRQCVIGLSDTPVNYWANTSGNDILKQLLSRADKAAQKDYIDLMAGKSIWKPITSELTFSDLDTKPGALWSMMVASGYLTVRSKKGSLSELAAPNREVRWLLSESLQDWLSPGTKIDDKLVPSEIVQRFAFAIEQGKPVQAESTLNEILSGMLKPRANSRSVKRREDLYQGIILGLLRQEWIVWAEVSSGEGYVDVSFKATGNLGVVIEVKDTGDCTLEHGCSEALKQIQDNNYTKELLDEGCSTVLCYGIAFKLGQCKIALQGAPDVESETAKEGEITDEAAEETN